MAKTIQIEHVFKVFGDEPQQALALARQGHSKQDIVAQTGQSIGVFDASFTIQAGEIFVVMGLSGSGKSTLVRLINRLIEPTAGRILVDGENINDYGEAQLRAFRRKDISMVFQSFALLPHLTVLDNTAFGLELAGVDKATRNQTVFFFESANDAAYWADGNPDIELDDGQWHHVAALYDGQRLALYVDGLLEDSLPASGTIAADDQPVMIGCNPAAYARRFNGWIDDVRLYGYALGEDEIKALARGTTEQAAR